MNRRQSRGYFLTALGAIGAPISTSLSSRAVAADAYTLRLSSANAATAPQPVAGTRFAAAVARRTNGQVQIEVFPNYTLTKEGGIIEGLLSGGIDFVMTTPSVLVPLAPRYQIFDMPFLFKDLATCFRVLEGPIGNELSAELEAKGIVPLCWGENGTREFGTTTKSIVVPDDMKGLRVRIQSGAVYVAMFQALGAIPVVIDSSEAFVAVSQHTVEGVDYGLLALAAGKYYTLIKHVAMSEHIFSPAAIFASKRKIDALPVALQRIIREEAKAVVPYWRQLSAQATTDGAEILKQNGVAFTDPQRPAFRKAMDPVYAAFQSRPGGDLIERINRLANS